MKFGIKILRVVALLWFIWMAVEGIRAYYFARADLDRFMRVAEFLLGPWAAVFAAAAGGSHAKRLTEAIVVWAKGKTGTVVEKSVSLPGIVG